jgi:uncharacterized protein DUF4432
VSAAALDKRIVGRAVTLQSEELRVVVLPDHGCDIASIVDRASDTELLFQAPWGRRDRRYLPARTDSQTAWLDAYAGGWQVLCPNAGFEADGPGVRWGYHGEACLLAWDLVEEDATEAELQVALATAPLRIHRRLSLRGGTLRVDERLVNDAPVDVEVAWVQHPAFGAPLVDGGRLETTAGLVRADAEIPGDILPGAEWPWPYAVDRAGRRVDLSALPAAGERRSVFAYLKAFKSTEAAIVNDRIGIRACLRWSADPWPSAWLWQEVHATPTHPWFGRAHVVAVEPASTVPGGALVRVAANGEREGWIELEVTR